MTTDTDKKLREALDWLVHLHNGCGKAGHISPGEWEDAIKNGMAALTDSGTSDEEIINICEHGVVVSDRSCPQCATADAPPEPTEEMVERINEAMRRIGKMCSEGRPPRMSIPVRLDDDDVFICDTLRECRAALAAAPKEGRDER